MKVKFIIRVLSDYSVVDNVIYEYECCDLLQACGIAASIFDVNFKFIKATYRKNFYYANLTKNIICGFEYD